MVDSLWCKLLIGKLLPSPLVYLFTDALKGFIAFLFFQSYEMKVAVFSYLYQCLIHVKNLIKLWALSQSQTSLLNALP